VGAVLDEVAVWRDETTASPDSEVVAALRPGMATVPGALLLGISSPYARRGVLWEQYREHFGKASDVLVWQAPSRAMNPTVPASVVARALEEDESAARAEYLAEFRRDIEGWITREAVGACVVEGRLELPPLPDFGYRAFCDPSGGSNDAMTLAVAHREGERVVLDLVRERRPPFSPQDVVEEFADLLKRYRVGELVGDRYGAGWVSERFSQAGIRYKPAAKSKSELYRDVLPALNSGTVELLDERRLVAQLCSLERRTARGGRESIDHPPHAHDDLANAVAGVLSECQRSTPVWDLF